MMFKPVSFASHQQSRLEADGWFQRWQQWPFVTVSKFFGRNLWRAMKFSGLAQ
jgi:hypothetical protein